MAAIGTLMYLCCDYITYFFGKNKAICTDKNMVKSRISSIYDQIHGEMLFSYNETRRIVDGIFNIKRYVWNCILFK